MRGTHAIACRGTPRYSMHVDVCAVVICTMGHPPGRSCNLAERVQLPPLQGGDSRFMQAMGSGYARFTFVVVATLLTIHALDLQMTPNADPAHSAATTAKFFTGAGLPSTGTSIVVVFFGLCQGVNVLVMLAS